MVHACRGAVAERGTGPGGQRRGEHLALGRELWLPDDVHAEIATMQRAPRHAPADRGLADVEREQLQDRDQRVLARGDRRDPCVRR